ncbi:MAG: 16S rRNA (cytosine(1402)-N(4))-methyltransferase RsmH, partial [Steroidobacter sp.]
AAGRERFANDGRMTLVSSAFSRLSAVMSEMGLAGAIDGVLLDLGVSSPQLDDASRGFSFMQDGPLDRRMDDSSGASAADFVAKAPEHDIARIIRDFGEERFAKRIARAIVNARREAPIVRTAQLADIVARSIPTREPGKHPATRTFQAIRIQVNQEFEEIRAALNGSLAALAPQGRLCVISFHSLEDTLVKRFMQQHSQEDPVYAGVPDVPAHARPKLKRVGKAIHPSEEEIAANPRSRSSVLRVAERVAA